MAKMFKNKCTEFSAYDVLIPLEDITGSTGELPLTLELYLTGDSAVLIQWTFTLLTTPILTNPLAFTIPGNYNQIIDRGLQSELRQLAVIAYYDLTFTKMYTKEFEYWVESAFISKEDSTLSNSITVSDMEISTETTTPAATVVP